MNTHVTDTFSTSDTFSPQMRLASIARRGDGYAAILDAHGLDFCCGGRRTLSEACSAAGVEIDRVMDELARQARTPVPEAPAPTEWDEQPLPRLIDHIVDTHHAFTRSELARIATMLPKVLDKHGARHPQLERVAAAFAELAADLGPHMMREERVLFPYIRALAASDAVPRPPFGTIRNPVRMMEAEHLMVGQLLSEIWDLTAGLSVPQDACATFRALYAALAALRADLLKHIGLENDVLFPRALTAEIASGARRTAASAD